MKYNSKFKKGDIIVSTGNEFPDNIKNQPILVLKDMTGDENLDKFCHLCFGISGTLIKFWHNPNFAVLYELDKNNIRYQLLVEISKYLTGKISEQSLKEKIGEIHFNDFKKVVK